MNTHVVFNLKKSEVTWAASFIEASRFSNISYSDIPNPNTAINLYLGDDIDWDSAPKLSLNVYYLAATSFNSMINASKAEQGQEIRNFAKSDFVVLVSKAELEILKLQLPWLNFSKFVVLGFPINFEKLTEYRTKIKKDRSVCFVSNLTPIKRPEFQMELCEFLLKQGFEVSHFSSLNSPMIESLRKIGCQVFERLNPQEFLKSMAGHQYFISTSSYESLSVSGIEAAVMGLIPICPSIGGFKDWCAPENLYGQYEPEHVVEVMSQAREMALDELSWLSGKLFFEGLKKLANE